MSTLKDRLETDLRAAMKARDELVTSTLRMALTAEAKKRREAATAFGDAGRAGQAERERAEEGVLVGYLPSQLADEELARVVTEALAGLELTGKGAMGPAMKAAQAAVAGRAEGGRVAAEVRRQLG